MKKLILSIGLALTILTACTDNQSVRQFGGTATLDLPQNQKLVNATWKQDNLWVLTKEMSSTDSAETYNFKEDSSFGIMEGTYIIKESK